MKKYDQSLYVNHSWFFILNCKCLLILQKSRVLSLLIQTKIFWWMNALNHIENIGIFRVTNCFLIWISQKFSIYFYCFSCAWFNERVDRAGIFNKLMNNKTNIVMSIRIAVTLIALTFSTQNKIEYGSFFVVRVDSILK